MKALCIGRSNYNFYSKTDSFETKGGVKDLTDTIEGAGGSGAMAAYTLGKFGSETYLGSVVGDDTFGNLVKKELEKVGVHSEYMETAYDKRTNINLTLIKTDTKEKMSYNISKDKLNLKKTEFQMEPDLVYSDGSDYGASLAAYNKFSSKITIMNAKVCTQEILELCKYSKYIIAPQEFAEWVSGTKIDFDNPGSLVTVFSNLLRRFVQKEIIVTLGGKGALYISNNQIKVMPGLTVQYEDDSGAGDVFGGAFAHALLLGYDLEKSITFANIAGGLSVAKLGMKESVPDVNDVMTYFNQKYGAPAANPTSTTPATPAA